MTTLVTGANGKIGKHLSTLLHENGKPFVVASHSASKSPASSDPYTTVQFDWFDASTFSNPFDTEPSIDRLYLVSPPGSTDSLCALKPFLEIALNKGVKRIVFVSASQVEKGGPALGKIHEYLDGLGPEVRYTVLRPTWFIENFANGHLYTIKHEDMIYSYTGDGRIPFVGAKDIAQAAFNALYDDDLPSGRQPRILGPELYSYDEVAAIFSDILGRQITHKKLNPGEPRKPWVEAGLPESYQKALTFMELAARNGSEEGFFSGNEEKIVGLGTLREFVLKNRECW